MKELRNFNIDIYRLSNSIHEYSFDINDSFFESFESSIIQKGRASAKVILRKTDALIEANFEIDGTVELECDRSLELFDFPIHTKHRVLYKYGAEEMELDDDIIVITKLTQKINVAQHIYEFINVAVPMRKISPEYQDDEDEEEEDEIKLIYSSVGPEDSDDKEDLEDTENEEDLDPRWSILKNLKNNTNDN